MGCIVLLPYEFTLFSNNTSYLQSSSSVLLPYEFTLFSNTQTLNDTYSEFYYLMNLHYSQTV